MISLHSVLAGSLAAMIPTVFTVIAVMAIGMACIMGFVKGFRKVSWNGLIWLGAGALFVFGGKAFSGKAFGGNAFGDGSLVGTMMILLFALACVLASMAAFGILGHFVRPRVRWIKDEVNGDTSLAEYGLEFEPEYLDYDGENDPNPYGKMIYKTGCGTPSFFGRILGALTCGVNVALILWAVACVALLAVDATSLKGLGFGVIIEDGNVQKLLESARSYALDMLSLGVIFAVAKKGYENGLLNSVRGFLMTVGGIALIGVCFWLPFSAYASLDQGLFHFLYRLVERCTAMFSGVGGQFSGAIARVFAGALMAGVSAILLILLNVLLVKCCNFVSAAGPTRVIDGCLATVLYLVIGALVCVAIWFVLSALNYFGVLKVSEVLTESATLSNGLLKFAAQFVEKLIAPVLGK